MQYSLHSPISNPREGSDRIQCEFVNHDEYRLRPFQSSILPLISVGERLRPKQLLDVMNIGIRWLAKKGLDNLYRGDCANPSLLRTTNPPSMCHVLSTDRNLYSYLCPNLPGRHRKCAYEPKQKDDTAREWCDRC